MSLPPPGPEHTLELTREAIDAFELDLDGLTVLTEAASGPFVVTPLLAALAGAARVLALTAPSRHATVDEVAELTAAYATRFDVASRVEVITERDDPRMAEAAVVTNLGFVRPLDRPLLQRLGPDAAVALMCEPWELRPDDVDLPACRALGIPALGTNEDDERLKMFDYLPVIAGKLLGELGRQPAGARLVLISAGRFATALERGLGAMGAEVASFTPAATGSAAAADEPAGDASSRPSLSSAAFADAIRDADALVVADYPGSGPILGPRAAHSATDLRALNPTLVLAHIAGDVVLDDLERARLPHAPEQLAPAGSMSVTAGELGARPVIKLHGAGLRVGAELARARRRGLDAAGAEREVLDNLPLALPVPTIEEASV